MAGSDDGSATSIENQDVGSFDMKLEVVTLPVSDVDRAKRFYQSLGWRLDADIVAGDDFRWCSSRLLSPSARSTSARA
jgi:hypothetical protein